MPDYPLIVDISDHQGDLDQVALEIPVWKAQGVQYAIVRGHTPGYCRQACALFRSSGIVVLALYTLPIEWEYGLPAWATQQAVSLALELGVPLVIQDCEESYNDPADVLTQMRWNRDFIKDRGLQYGTYTYYYWWIGLGDPREFGSDLLWFANYVSRAPITEVNFGGWEKVWAHQYTSTPPLPFREHLDLSYYYGEDYMLEDILLSLYATQAELDGMKVGLPLRENLIATCKSRLAAVIAGDPNNEGYKGGVAFEIWDHKDAPHGGNSNHHHTTGGPIS